MKRTVWLLILAIILCMSSCVNDTSESEGSFTSKKTYSYDEKYYALQVAEMHRIKVLVYLTDTDELIYEFEPARAMDFHGICWESSTYNIWIQSGDIGVLCYAFKDETWNLDYDAKRPKDIVSKYD